MRDALQAIATESFDVAMIEQIFLAPYRTLIEAPTILAEQNIESSLLAQTAGSSFYGQLTQASKIQRKRQSCSGNTKMKFGQNFHGAQQYVKGSVPSFNNAPSEEKHGWSRMGSIWISR